MPVFPNSRTPVAAAHLLSTLAILALVPPAAALERPLTDALPSGRPSCHARAFDTAEQAARPDRRVTFMSLERSARDITAERKWGAREELDGTRIVSANLRVRLRGDPVTRSARLACYRSVDEVGALVCETPACEGGEVRLRAEGKGIALSIGGRLKSGRFVGHYIHLEESCEGRAGGPLVLESGEEDRAFSLRAAAKEACQ